MTEDLIWQQMQSAEPFSDEVATHEKQTEQTVCLGWTSDAITPVIQGDFCGLATALPNIIRLTN